MKNNTLNDYKKAIRAKYHEIVNHNPDGYLLNPSPGNLRDKCLLLLNNIDDDDQRNYKHFFELNEDIDTRKQIENFDINKFRPLQSFLLGKNENPSEKKLEILAILVELELRPFKKFRETKNSEFKPNPAVETAEEKAGTTVHTAAIDTEESKVKDEKAEEEIKYEQPEAENKKKEEELKPDNNRMPAVITKNFYSDNKEQAIHSSKSPYKLKAKYIKIAAVIIGVLVLGYVLKNIYTDHECMTWKTDHYEIVPCNTDVKSFMRNTIVRLNEETLKYQKKITPCDTTTFFIAGGKPCVWYCKMPDGTVEFFSYPGLHPVTGETLKKITQHIVDKYAVKN